MSNLPINKSSQPPKVQNKGADLLTTMTNTVKNMVNGLTDLLSGDAYKKTHILRVDSLKHEAFLEKIALEINNIHDELNSVRQFNFKSKKLFEETSNFMNDASTEFNQLLSLKGELENILNLNLTDLSHYLEEVAEIKELLHSNKEEYSKILLKTNNIENTFKTFYERVRKVEDDNKLLFAKDNILFNSIEGINTKGKELSLELDSQKRDLKILYTDLLKTDETFKSYSVELNEKNNILEKKVEKMKLWIIILFASILAFAIIPTILNLLTILWS